MFSENIAKIDWVPYQQWGCRERKQKQIRFSLVGSRPKKAHHHTEKKNRRTNEVKGLKKNTYAPSISIIFN